MDVITKVHGACFRLLRQIIPVAKQKIIEYGAPQPGNEIVRELFLTSDGHFCHLMLVEPDDLSRSRLVAGLFFYLYAAGRRGQYRILGWQTPRSAAKVSSENLGSALMRDLSLEKLSALQSIVTAGQMMSRTEFLAACPMANA